MQLDSTLRKLQIVLAAPITTNQLPVIIDYADRINGISTLFTAVSVTNGTTIVDILSAPAASTIRKVAVVNIRNADTAPATVTIIYNDNGTSRTLAKYILSVDDTLVFSDFTGWSISDGNGNFKTSAAGAVGPTGPIGNHGNDGRDGDSGEPGRDGQQGNDGAIGPAGPQGSPANPGTDGVDGIDGRDGLQGQTGPSGAVGNSGNDGRDGVDGNDAIDGAYVFVNSVRENSVSAVTIPAVPASTTAIANRTGVPVVVYIKGGTLTVITVGGVATGIAVAAAANMAHTIPLAINQTIAITYTVAPTWVWIGAQA